MPDGRRILVLDDDDVTRRVLAHTIAGIGHEVLEAASGEAATEMVGAGTIDAVVVGRCAGGGCGLAMCGRLRAASPAHLYVIALVSPATRGGRMAALRAGADEVLDEPIDLGEVCARLATVERILLLESALERCVRSLGEQRRSTG